MKTALLCSFTLLLVTTITFTQPPDTLWTRTYGGSNPDKGYSVQQTNDGEYIIAGNTLSYGAGYSDVWLIRTDANGDSLWSHTYGGSETEVGRSVQQTTDGGYIIAGYTSSYGAGNYDVWLIKTNAYGDSLWTRTFGGNDVDHGYCVQQTTDGGYIISGYTSSYGAGNYDVWLIRTNADGDSLWTCTFGGSCDEFGSCVQQTTDGGYCITGETYSYGTGYGDIWLIKTDTDGNEQWNRTFGGNNRDFGYSVQQTTDGGYIIAGYTGSYGAGMYDVWLIKTDANGDSLWSRTFGGIYVDRGYCVRQTNDGGYVITGSTEYYGPPSDVWVIKTDSLGNQQWTSTFGTGTDDNERGYSVQQTIDGGYIIAGYIESYGAGGADVLLIRLDSETSFEIEPDMQIPNQFALHPSYPNPFNPTTTINYEIPISTHINIDIYNTLGQKVATLFDGRQQPGHHTITWNATDVPSGIYFYKLESTNYTQTRKMVLLK